MKLFDSIAVALGSAVSFAAMPAFGISHDAFTPSGQGGSLYGQTLEVGSGGTVFQFDNYVNTGGGGDEIGIAPEFDVVFDATLGDGDTDLILTYELTRLVGSSDVTWISFLDADIDADTNTFFNESATTGGTLAAGQNFEVDEPGFLFGDIIDNIFYDELDGTNAFDGASPDDVSMALSFELGLMEAGDTAWVEIMISEDGDHLGPFWITHFDTDEYADTEITLSGRANFKGDGAKPIPEPSAALVFALGALFTSGAMRKRS